MNPTFKPPQTDEEFERRAKEVPTEGARAVLKSLKARQEAMIKSTQDEIDFYERILRERGEEL